MLKLTTFKITMINMLKKYVKEKVETLNIMMENYRRIEIIFEVYVEILQSKN